VTDDRRADGHAVGFATPVPLVVVLLAAGGDERGRLVDQDLLRVEVVAPVGVETAVHDGYPDSAPNLGHLLAVDLVQPVRRSGQWLSRGQPQKLLGGVRAEGCHEGKATHLGEAITGDHCRRTAEVPVDMADLRARIPKL
jgi:hypothetical protein